MKESQLNLLISNMYIAASFLATNIWIRCVLIVLGGIWLISYIIERQKNENKINTTRDC